MIGVDYEADAKERRAALLRECYALSSYGIGARDKMAQDVALTLIGYIEAAGDGDLRRNDRHVRMVLATAVRRARVWGEA